MPSQRGDCVALNQAAMNFLHATMLPGPLGTVLQTIVETTTGGMPSLFAVECLTRGPRGTKLEQAVPLFEYVRRRGLEKHTRESGIDPTRLIVEVGEHAPASDAVAFKAALSTLRESGVAIALD